MRLEVILPLLLHLHFLIFCFLFLLFLRFLHQMILLFLRLLLLLFLLFLRIFLILILHHLILVFYGQLHGYTLITSPFGRRYSPTYGASSYHEGIDIGAPAGSNIFSVLSGKVSLTEFYGSGGCTIIIDSGIYKIMYCHISPNFLVKVRRHSKTRWFNCICWA